MRVFVAVALALIVTTGCARQVGDLSADEAIAAVTASAPFQEQHRQRADAGAVTRATLDDLVDGWWRIAIVSDRADRLVRVGAYRVERRTGRIERQVDGAWVAVD